MGERLVFTPEKINDSIVTSFADLHRRLNAGEKFDVREAIESIKRSIAEGRPAVQADYDYVEGILKQGG